ncbi:hypothetical protein JW868_04620 [Candidatus Woesearchaeota archaeon]|nr:hypothetical protein [Candidatus Woesearchaeota archaeon]
MKFENIQGKQTIETLSITLGITTGSALNLVSKLKKQNLAIVTGGGKQKRIYTIYKLPTKPNNGFYEVVNKYSKEKLLPKYKHYIYGKYTIEHAIVDGICLGDIRTLNATKYLFNRVTNWKRLFDLAKKRNKTDEVHKLYTEARKTMRCRKMPKRYEK